MCDLVAEIPHIFFQDQVQNAGKMVGMLHLIDSLLFRFSEMCRDDFSLQKSSQATIEAKKNIASCLKHLEAATPSALLSLLLSFENLMFLPISGENNQEGRSGAGKK